MDNITSDGETVASQPDETKQSTCGKICLLLKNITVEPIIVLFLFPSVLLLLAAANLNLEKACRVNLQFNDTVCNALTIRNGSLYTPEQENMVQKEVAGMNAWTSVIKSIVPVCLLLILGAWSDKHNSRKPLMALPIIGEMITASGLLLCTYFFYEIPMEVNGVVETVPNALTGGWFTMFMAIFSYIAATSTVETRTVRIGAVNICVHGCAMVGLALSGILYHFIGVYAMLSMALVMYIIGLIYTIVVIKEKKTTVVNQNSNHSRCAACKDFFNFQHIKSTFMVALKRRKKNYRTRIFVTLISFVLILGPMHGEMGVIYLYTRKQFQWNEVEFSIFYSIYVVLHLIGTIIALALFSKWLKLDDTTIGLICYVGKFFSAFLFAFAKTPAMYCLGVVVEMLTGTTFVTLRSIATKLVSEEEQGKLNALTAIFEALMPLAFGSMYNLVYRSTIDVLPGAFFFIASILSLPAMGLFSWLHLQHRRDIKDHSKENLLLEDKKR